LAPSLLLFSPCNRRRRTPRLSIAPLARATINPYAVQALHKSPIGHEKLWLQEELHPTSWVRGLLFVQGLLYNIEEKAPLVAEPSRDLTSLDVSVDGASSGDSGGLHAVCNGGDECPTCADSASCASDNLFDVDDHLLTSLHPLS
jgi:hypothetical protein